MPEFLKSKCVKSSKLFRQRNVKHWKLRLQDFSLLETKVVSKDIQLLAQSQKSPTKLVVWSFCAQSTVPLLCSSLTGMMECEGEHFSTNLNHAKQYKLIIGKKVGAFKHDMAFVLYTKRKICAICYQNICSVPQKEPLDITVVWK